MRCCISFVDCVGGFAVGSYPVFLVAELGGDSPPPPVQPVMAVTAKAAATSTTGSQRGRIRLSMVACSPIVVGGDEQVVDATVEVWALNVGGTAGGSIRGDTADVSEAAGVAVLVEPWAAG